jgi:hypothetical protein
MPDKPSLPPQPPTQALCNCASPFPYFNPPPPWQSVDPVNRFNPKHARQQASLVANMRAAGLLTSAPRTVFVEMGAGKGWLTAWLAGESGAGHLVLVDRQPAFNGKVGGGRRGRARGRGGVQWAGGRQVLAQAASALIHNPPDHPDAPPGRRPAAARGADARDR